ncbi:hypothetical protein L3V83_13855 [Thiotrichales bacterium 19X7-9]|nr:hypothetical protein [Thiotrichales bacterium 19X7-9]
MEQYKITCSEDCHNLLTKILFDGTEINIEDIEISDDVAFVFKLIGDRYNGYVDDRIFNTIKTIREIMFYGHLRILLNGIDEKLFVKQDFDVRLSVSKGSTNLQVYFKKLIPTITKKVLAKMTGKQITIVVLVLFILWFGDDVYTKILHADEKNQNKQLSIELFKDEHKAFAEALNKISNLQKLNHENMRAALDIIKENKNADTIIIGKQKLDRKMISNMANINLKSSYETRTTEGYFFISGVKKVKNNDQDSLYLIDSSGNKLTASLEDKKQLPVLLSAYEAQTPLYLSIEQQYNDEGVKNSKILIVSSEKPSKDGHYHLSSEVSKPIDTSEIKTIN